MRAVIITLPNIFEGETALVNRLFGEGRIERLHLRKPKVSRQEMEEWIEQINPTFHPRIVLHDYHDLACSYNLGGIHLNGRNPDAPSWVGEVKAQRTFTVSRSCHSIAEVEQYAPLLDYVFLSPIFDSISKEGYGAAFSRQQLADALQRGIIRDNVYALGGISYENLDEVRSLGFGGYAMLGAFWREDPLCPLGISPSMGRGQAR